nr:MAG TPA: hypothetical protein [Caudoviricetes sp.]
MNTVRVSIGGQDFTKFANIPLTIQNTLNDTLDSAQVSFHNMRRSEPFEPMTDAVITVNGVDTAYKVAGDEVLEVFGAGRYSHTVTFIEYTKEAERLIMEAKAFTRPKIPDYSDGQTDVTVYLWEEDTALGTDGTLIGSDTSSAFASPMLKGGGAVAIPAISGILENTLAGYGTNAEASYWHITVFRSESPQNVASMEQAGALVYTSDSSQTTEREAIDLSEPGFYYFRYNYRNDSKYYSAMWQVSVVANPVARDPYTVRKVVDTLLTVCEPLRVGDDPRYRLEVKAGQMAVFSQDAPEFHFSNSRTLWENLREVGKYIHAIPRLVPRVGYTAVQFDELGGNQNADTSKGRRVSGSASWDISTYASGLETMAANLITAENDAQSTICEPFGKGWKSLRTASETARIQEETAHIETAFPIESVSRVLVYFQYGGKTYQGDITPYVFEKADYDLLSSYTGQYPNSKCFALYYARGNQNISGLWYKPNDEVASSLNAFQNYAIANICTAATGCSLNIFKQLTYPDICVRVEYIPTITARIHSYKPDAKSGGGFLSDGQAANRLSAKALGEHLRGQLAMLPSASKSCAWLFKDAGSIPEPGKLIDGQYISVVTARVYPAYCEAQIETVKGYNELGSYVELPTAFRQYEIPDSLERFTVLDEFVYISETAEADDADTICSAQLKAAVADALDGVTGTIARRVSLASVTTTDDSGVTIAADVLCPVMSLSVGNAVCFSFRMQDNYSAGNQSANGGKQYRMTQAVPYGDKYYGTAERLKFALYAAATPTGVIAGAHAFPATDGASITLGEAMASTGAKPLKWYKDSAEVGNVSYQLHAMTRDGFIIGDMLMAHCSAVRAVDEIESPVLYYYAEELNPLTGTDGTETVLGIADSVGAVSDADGWRIACVTVEPPEGFKSWAIKRGGDFLIGKNSGIVPKNIYLNFKRRIPK